MTEIIIFFSVYFGIGIIAAFIAMIIDGDPDIALTGALAWPLFIVVGVYALFAVLIHDGIRAIKKHIATKRGQGNDHDPA